MHHRYKTLGLDFRYDGFLALRKGDSIKITWAYSDDFSGPRQVSRLTNETAQVDYKSRTEGIISNNMSHHLAQPIIGTVVSSEVGGDTTYFTIEPEKMAEHTVP
jgi:hypothetical protein